MLYFKEKIPKDWQIEPIVNLIENYQQGFASGARDNDGILQLRMNNITTGGRVILDKFLKVPIPDNIDNYLLKKDDVIFNNTNSVKLIGKTAIFNEECDYCTFSNHLTRLRSNKSKVSPHWLLYHFNQAWRKHYFRRICNAHVNQAGIKREDIENFEIPLPKLSEQIIIISKINNIQNLIGKINIIINQLQLLKKGLMQRLFTEGIGQNEFKETRLGKIPQEWEIVNFNDSIIKQKYKLSSLKTSEYQLTGSFPIIDQGKDFISGYSDRAELLYNDDLPVVIFGDHTRIFKFVDFKFICGADGTKVLIPNRRLFDPLYLYYAYSNFRIKNLGYSRHYKLLKELKIPKPQLEEQIRISSILGNIDAQILAKNKIMGGFKLIKKGLMQDLLTGKKRVKIN